MCHKLIQQMRLHRTLRYFAFYLYLHYGKQNVPYLSLTSMLSNIQCVSRNYKDMSLILRGFIIFNDFKYSKYFNQYRLTRRALP